MFYYIKNTYPKKEVEDVNQLFSKYQNPEIEKADFFVTAGGDGAMIKAVQEYHKYIKPFYGINAGTVGFFMNRINLKTFSFQHLDINELTKVDVKTIEVKVDGLIYQAFNEVMVGGDMATWSEFWIQYENNSKANFKGNGLIISTPQGSTAINKSNGGEILDMSSDMWSVTSDKGVPKINLILKANNINIDYNSRHDINLWIDGTYKIIKEPKNIQLQPGISVSLLFSDLEDFFSRRKDS